MAWDEVTPATEHNRARHRFFMDSSVSEMEVLAGFFVGHSVRFTAGGVHDPSVIAGFGQ